MKSSLKIAKPEICVPNIWVPKRRLTVVNGGHHTRDAIPWWARGGKPPAVTPPFTWDPSQIATGTLNYYLEADTVSTTGTAIDQATDKSVAGRHFTSTGANRPTLIASGLNGKPTMGFASASSSFLSRSAVSFKTYGNSCFNSVLFKLNTLPGAGSFFILTSLNTSVSGADQGFFVYLSSHSAGTQYPISAGFAGSFNPGIDVTLATGTWYLLVFRFLGGSVSTLSNYRFNLNGVAQTVVNTTSGTGNSTVNELGRYPGGSLYLNGEKAYTLDGQGSLDDTETSLLYQYGQHHYGMA